MMLSPFAHQGGVDRCPVGQLEAALSACGWSDKAALYRNVFVSMDVNRKVANARASAIVISHRTHTDTGECLSLLKASGGKDCELIFVSNGVPRVEFQLIQQTVDIFIELNCNTGAFVARNIGAVFASSPILVFVEDDCIPYLDLIGAHIEAHERYDCISVRGVYEPKTDNPLNSLAAHYDLGGSVFPQHVVAEGNASYRSETFYAVGGWDDQIRFGGAGTDLALRLLNVEPDMRRQIYYPKARIRHDYAVDEKHLARKRDLQEASFMRLQAKHGEYRMARWAYRKYLPGPCAGQTTFASPLASTRRYARVTRRWDKERAISLIVINHGIQQSNDSIETITKLRNEDWDVLFVNSAEYVTDPRHGSIQWSASPASNEKNPLVSAINNARGKIVLFVDAATRITAEAIRSHIALYQEFDIIAVQGRVRAPAGSSCRGHDWYPMYEFPIFTNLPVNISYRRDLLKRVINKIIFRSPVGGLALSMSLLALEPDFRKQIFSPRPVMIWDALSQDPQYPGVALPHARPGNWRDLLLICQTLFGVGGIIPRRGCDRERRGREALRQFIDEHHYGRAVQRLLKAIGYYPEIVYGHFSLRYWSILDIINVLRDLRAKQQPSCDVEVLFGRYKRKELPWFTCGFADVPIYDIALGPDCVEPKVVRMLTDQVHRLEASVDSRG